MGRPMGSTNKEKEETTEKGQIEMQEPEAKIQFFSEVDMDDHGRVTSEMPVWYFDVHIEFLREDVARDERALAAGLIIPEQIPMMREQLKKSKAKLKKIEESKPELKGRNKDRCWRAYESIAKQISDTMPTRKENLDGLVNPQDELRRLKTKHISIDPEIAKACGVKVLHGKVTGDEAAKCFQILGRALGEKTNTEYLRRDGNTEAYKSMDDLTQSILKGMQIKGT